MQHHALTRVLEYHSDHGKFTLHLLNPHTHTHERACTSVQSQCVLNGQEPLPVLLRLSAQGAPSTGNTSAWLDLDMLYEQSPQQDDALLFKESLGEAFWWSSRQALELVAVRLTSVARTSHHRSPAAGQDSFLHQP